MIGRRLWKRFRRDRRAAIALLFGLLIVPLVGIVGLAVDYAVWNQVQTAMVAAASSAVQQAIKIAAGGELAGDANYVAEAESAGRDWFTAQVGGHAATLTSVSPVVTVTPGVTITATVTASGTMASIFGRIFGAATYPITVEAGASVQIAPYEDITVLIDNSPSMVTGATPADIATLLQLIPCSASGAYYPNNSGKYTKAAGSFPASTVAYEYYQCVSGTKSGNVYDGAPPCPLTAASPYTFSTFSPVGSSAGTTVTGPTCKGYLPAQSPSGKYPMAGAPCGFACHFDTSKPAGTGNDYFAVARSTIGGSNAVTLRFDVVKAATNYLLSQMQARAASFGNVKTNIFTFDLDLHPLYPGDGSYGSNWTAAINAVGARATAPNTPDTGLQPYLSGTGDPTANTDFTTTMTTLIGHYLSAAGTGFSAASPRKALILLTDGMQNGAENEPEAAFSPAACQTLKNEGYTIFVLQTTYYPHMNNHYLTNDMTVAEGTGPTSISYNLTQCASSTSDIIIANDTASVKAALLTFLNDALSSPIVLTK